MLILHPWYYLCYLENPPPPPPYLGMVVSLINLVYVLQFMDARVHQARPLQHMYLYIFDNHVLYDNLYVIFHIFTFWFETLGHVRIIEVILYISLALLVPITVV